MKYSFSTELYKWTGDKSSWFFVNVPIEESDEIEEVASASKRGFGSVRVEVLIGKTTWRTSVFPDTKNGCYVLPIKKSVRKDEGLEEGAFIDLEISVVELS